MKKLRGIMAILAATALIFGTVACSDGGGNDNNKNTDQSEPINGGGGSGESDPITGGGGSEGGDEGGSTSLEVVYKAEEITVAEVALMKDSSGSAPSAGATTKLAAGTYSIWGGKGSIVTAADKMAVQINSGKTTPDSIVSATNMGGVNATAVPVVGANISTLAENSALTNYVVVDTAAAGNTAITLNITLGQSTKTLPAGLSYWVLATDTDGKILAVYDVGDVATTYSNYEKKDISLGTAALTDKVCFGFARGAGSGSLKIHSITLTTTAKSTQAAPVAAHFVATACTTSDQNDGKIVISDETASNLESKISTGDTWADVTSLTIEDLEPGTYLFRYKETDDKLASEAIEVTVDSWVDTSIVFTKFDAADVRGGETGDLNITKETSAADGTWTLVADSNNAKAQVKAGPFATYDYVEGTSGYSWADRLSYNKKTGVTLKLKVGAGATKILRVDGGSVKTLPSSGKTNLTFKGAGEAVVWEPYVSNSTTYVEVTGDADGYVSITSTDTTNGANIYGITVVESKPATLPGAVELETKLTTAAVYSAPVISEGYTTVATQGETLTATATLTQPTKSTSTPVYADGTLGTPVEGTESVDESSVTWTTTYGEQVLKLGTGLSLAYATSATATDANYVPASTYSVTASYKIGETAYTSEPISVQVKEAGATYVTVTFNANGGTDGSITTQDVESGAATALTTVSALGLTAPSGKTFAGWALTADATEAAYADGAEITVTEATVLYAVWEELTGPVSYGLVTFNSSLSNTALSYVTIEYDSSYTAAYKDYASTLDGSSTETTAEGYLKKGLKVNGSTKIVFTFKQKTECTLYMLQNNTQGHGFTFTNSEDNTKSYTCAYSTNTAGTGVKAITFTLEAGTYTFTRDGSSSKEYSLGGIVFTSAN